MAKERREPEFPLMLFIILSLVWQLPVAIQRTLPRSWSQCKAYTLGKCSGYQSLKSSQWTRETQQGRSGCHMEESVHRNTVSYMPPICLKEWPGALKSAFKMNSPLWSSSCTWHSLGHSACHNTWGRRWNLSPQKSHLHLAPFYTVSMWTPQGGSIVPVPQGNVLWWK